MTLNNKLPYFLSILLFILPVLTFLNEINLPQITRLEIYLLFSSQFFFLVIAILFSLIIHHFFLKNKIEFKKFFLANSLIFFLLLFFQNVKSLLFFEKQNFIFDEIFTLFIYIIVYFLIFFSLKKKLKLVNRFLIIFILLQFLNFTFNLTTIRFNSEKKIEFMGKKSEKLNFDISLLKEKKKSGNIFFVILDGMMTLESAEKLKIIKNKQEIINSLEKDEIYYKKDFLVNYDTTYLSLASLLQGAYPINDKSKRYKTRKNFYPHFLLDQKKDNNFFKILRKTKKNFFYLGNSNAPCQKNIYVNCLRDNKSEKLFSMVNLFYIDSIFIYAFNYIPYIYYNPYEAINFINMPKNVFKKNEIYFLHVLNPHPPYFLNKNCNFKKKLTKTKNQQEEIQNYTYAYNCLIKMTQKFMKKISEIDNDNLVFVMGDHGWSFSEETMKKSNLTDNKFKTYFTYKAPSRCSQLIPPNSIVNVLRFALNCNGSNKINYLEDLQFKTFYEGHENYGKVFLKN